ncbi:MAG: biotin--[acetyl-CoA-carboxylase] ligase [Candidatus Aerophobetes bacterium]|nr:biotin--[acetyl-CoA-carboxylase] ligase [Candidatus Aerophobetes bacterium]
MKEAKDMVELTEQKMAMGKGLFGKKIYSYALVSSTMKIAYSLAKKGAEEGTVIVAEEQTQGRGRGNRYWFSPRGGFWFSLILRPQITLSDVTQLNILGAVGIVEVIRKDFFLLSPQIRWPNDALIRRKKVGGVLCIAKSIDKNVDFVIMGIGINLNIDEFPSPLCFTATSLKREVGHYIPREVFLSGILRELEKLYLSSREGFSLIIEKARLFSSLLGRQVKVCMGKEEFVGLAQDLDEKGELIIRLENGTYKRVDSREDFLIR